MNARMCHQMVKLIFERCAKILDLALIIMVFYIAPNISDHIANYAGFSIFTTTCRVSILFLIGLYLRNMSY